MIFRCNILSTASKALPRQLVSQAPPASPSLLRSAKRHASTATRPATHSSPPKYGVPRNTKFAYPSRLLIYNAGTGKNALVGSIKLTPVLLFVASCVIAAPIFYTNAEAPSYMPVVAIIAGAVPMIIVAVVTAPYVGTVHIRLPPMARKNFETVKQFCASLPPSTELEITTARLFGLKKATYVRLDDLRTIKKRFGRLANMQRVDSQGSLLMNILRENRTKFYIDHTLGGKRSAIPGIWEVIMARIQKQSR